MNWVDILLLIVMIMSIVAGIQRGLIISALDLLSWIGSFTIAFISYGPLSDLFRKVVPALIFFIGPLTFVLSVTIARLILDTLAYRIIRNFPQHIHTNTLNKMLGIIPGFITGLIWAAIFSALLFFIPFSSQVSHETQNARLAESLVGKVSWLQEKLYPVFNDVFDQGTHKNVKLSKEKLVKLPFTVKTPKVRTDLEAQLLVLVNQERTKRGLKALKADPEMAVVARKHAADMFARGYFSHYSPEGMDPFDRIREEKLSFLTAGENLALAQTLPIAHTGLMNSPGHRANILSPYFSRLGIGILDGGIYGYMITQNFRN